MKQAPGSDGFSFDPFSLLQDGLAEMTFAARPAALSALMLSLGLLFDPGEATRALLTGLAVQLIGFPPIPFAVSRGPGRAPALTGG